MSALQVTLTVWAVVAAIYLLLFLYRSIVGMKEEDTLYLSAGETRLAQEQQEVMKLLSKIEPVTKWFGWATLVMTVLLCGIWAYSVFKDLF